jgi:hypothetical protein
LSTLDGCNGFGKVLPGFTAERAETHQDCELLLSFVLLTELKIELSQVLAGTDVIRIEVKRPHVVAHRFVKQANFALAEREIVVGIRVARVAPDHTLQEGGGLP